MKQAFMAVITSAFGVWAASGSASPAGYLVEQNYGAVGSPVSILSGWDVDKAGGKLTNGSLWVDDTSDQAGVTLKRRFLRQTDGQVSLEFHFLLNKKVNGVTWQLRDGETVAVKILTSGGNLCFENAGGLAVALQSYAANTNIGVKVVVDLPNQRADYYVNGKLKAASQTLRNPARALDNFYLYTGESGTLILLQKVTNIHRGYLVNESFVAQVAGSVPDDWTVDAAGGEARVISNLETSTYPGCVQACLLDTNQQASVSLSKAFAPQAVRLGFEFSFLQPSRADGFSAELRSEDGAVATFLTQGGNLCYVASNGTPVSVWDSYRSNVWYFVRIVLDPQTGTGDVSINDIPKATGVRLASASAQAVAGVRFATSEAGSDLVCLDDILLYPDKDAPADYVPPPVPVPHAPYLIGAPVCNLWREGSQFGWDWISSDPERSPILGFYDDGEAEVADWEIKFLVDHGVDFIAPCWYRPQSGTGSGPIKNGIRRGVYGYKRAKYSSAIRYALIIETANAPMYSLSDWQNNVVPFLVEHYFKDPRYLVVDSKPVVAFFGGIRNTGDEAAARSAINSQCVAAGFAGATLIGCTTSSDVGFEYMYTYAKSFTAESVTNRISSPSVNWDRSAWDLPYQDAGVWRSAAEYKSQLLAQKSNLVSKVGLAQAMWLLGNWNEYGEGHFLMPTEGLGFRYLDVIREVFGDGSPHTDVWPTPEQKARVNVLYPQPRIIVQPTDQRAAIGTEVSFDVKSVGFSPCAFQWRKDGSALAGETNACLMFASVLPENQEARFSVTVSNAISQAISREALLEVVEYDPLCRMKVTFPGYDRSETLTNFPVLVRFSPAMANGFSYAQFASASGFDLRFTDAAETQALNFEIEKWDTNGESFVWVQVPRFARGTWIWASWGDFRRARTAPACWTNGATWDGSFSAVWHMKEGAGTSLGDSTVNTNNGTLYRGTGWADGPAGPALLFDGDKTNYVNAGKNASLSLTNRFTVSAWISPSGYQSTAYYGLVNGFLSRGAYSAATLNYALELKNSTTVSFVKRATEAEGLKYYDFTVPDLGAEWTFLSVGVADGTLSLYENGTLCGTKAVGPIGFVSGSDALYLGCIMNYRGETAFSGRLDEVRIANVSRSSDWVWASWMNMASNNVFAVQGAVSGGSADWDLNANGLPDLWERFYFGGTNETAGGAADDWDHDGVNNYGEYVAGTCPTNGASVLEIDDLRVDPVGGRVALRWPSKGGRRYAVEASTNLCLGFDRLLGSQILATPVFNSYTVQVEQAESLFFRLQVER